MPSLGIKLGIRLREYRESKHRTQEWLAGQLNLSRATINRWETKGAGNASLDEIEMIADHMGTTPAELLGLSIQGPDHDLTECARRIAEAASRVTQDCEKKKRSADSNHGKDGEK